MPLSLSSPTPTSTPLTDLGRTPPSSTNILLKCDDPIRRDLIDRLEFLLRCVRLSVNFGCTFAPQTQSPSRSVHQSSRIHQHSRPTRYRHITGYMIQSSIQHRSRRSRNLSSPTTVSDSPFSSHHFTSLFGRHIAT